MAVITPGLVEAIRPFCDSLSRKIGGELSPQKKLKITKWLKSEENVTKYAQIWFLHFFTMAALMIFFIVTTIFSIQQFEGLTHNIHLGLYLLFIVLAPMLSLSISYALRQFHPYYDPIMDYLISDTKGNVLYKEYDAVRTHKIMTRTVSLVALILFIYFISLYFIL